ncbi:unnamed protein product [Thlaspi arvense]|uniref:DUF7903 domain-containing protein n=1 Tax=Thlaspi arvense TaxID=13288 RepID=A0AAU9S372_THLAR|nr:unnamed protein product [Thlaspi arvense]
MRSAMSYIPPHKRHLKDPLTPTPLPDYLITKSKKKTDFKSISSAIGNVIAYSRDAISKWFLIGSNGTEYEVPSSLSLVPLSSDFEACIYGEKPLVLMINNVQKENMITEGSEEEEERTRWMLVVAEKVEKDLVLAYEQAKKGMEDHNHVYNDKLRLVARLGKILFRRLQAGPVAERSLRNSVKVFTTNVPTSYIQNIKSKAVPRHEFCLVEEKVTYILKVEHYTLPDATIYCKCTMKEDGRLRRWTASAEIRPVRHLVVDVSCIDKNLDMRLMLAGRRKIKTLTYATLELNQSFYDGQEKEISNIQELLDSATVDPNVKGRLRWPLGKTSSGDGYSVFDVCHVRATTYKNQTLGLKIREADRFNVRFGTEEIEKGVTLILQDMNIKLQEQNIESVCVSEMLRDALGTIWDFLQYDDAF